MLVALPRGLGNLLLGKELWRPASRLVMPMTLSAVGYCLISGATAGLHALGVAKRSLRATLITSCIYLGCTLTGAYLGGAAGTAYGAAVATGLGAVIWWSQLRVAMRDSDKIPARGRNSSSRKARSGETLQPNGEHAFQETYNN